MASVIGSKGLVMTKAGSIASARQQPFRVGGDEDDRGHVVTEDAGDRVRAVAARAEIDVREDQAGFGLAREFHRIGFGGRHAGDLMAAPADQILDIHRDDRFVLDDQDGGLGDLA